MKRSYWLLLAVVVIILGMLAAFGQPPMPPLPKTATKAQSPKAAAAPEANNKAMAVVATSPPIISITNSFSATYEPTKITGLSAIFLSSPTLVNPSWTIWFTTNYPTNGGTIKANFSATNQTYFLKAAYHFNYTNGGA